MAAAPSAPPANSIGTSVAAARPLEAELDEALAESVDLLECLELCVLVEDAESVIACSVR